MNYDLKVNVQNFYIKRYILNCKGLGVLLALKRVNRLMKGLELVGIAGRKAAVSKE